MKVMKITKGPDQGGLFIRLNQAEAYRLIWSLAEQLHAGNPNAGRHEARDDQGHYFSIAVVSQ